MDGSTVVYFVRHGQSECNRLGRASGWSQTPLSELGREQARKAGALLSGLEFDRVYSSDLTRAVETCHIALPGVEPEQSPLLREIDVGRIQGTEYAQLREQDAETYSIVRKYRDFSPYGGESPNVAQERLHRFVETELNNLPGGTRAAVFCHLGTIMYMLNYVLGIEIPRDRLQLDNAAVFKFVRLKSGKWQLSCWNATGKI